MNTEAGLEIKGLVKKLPGFQLGPIDLSWVTGKAHGLLGPNGAGKTTLLSCLRLQSRTSAGTVFFDDQQMLWGSNRWKEIVSFVGETPHFYGELTVAETLRFAAWLSDKWDAAFVDAWQPRLGLSSHARVDSLSKGTTMKLALLLGLAYRTKILLMDEPTGGLDPESRRNLQGLLRQLVEERSLCLVLSSHLFEDIETIAHDVSIIRSRPGNSLSSAR